VCRSAYFVHLILFREFTVRADYTNYELFLVLVVKYQCIINQWTCAPTVWSWTMLWTYLYTTQNRD